MNRKIIATFLALGMALTAFSAIAIAGTTEEPTTNLWGGNFQLNGFIFDPAGVAIGGVETAASFEIVISHNEDGDSQYWPEVPAEIADNECNTDQGMYGFQQVDESLITFDYYVCDFQPGEPGGFNQDFKIWVNGTALNTPGCGDGWCTDAATGLIDTFTFPGSGASYSMDIRMPLAGDDATATGPAGVGPAATTITYTWNGAPASVELFYSENGGAFVSAGIDATVDGNYAFVCPGGAGDTYDWIANVPGGSDDGVGIPGGPAEAGTYTISANAGPAVHTFSEAGPLLAGDHTNQQVTITCTVDDSGNEGDWITGATISVDGGAYQAMVPQTALDSAVEVFDYVFSPPAGFYAEGVHNYDVIGTDAGGGVTNPAVADSFTIADTTDPTGLWTSIPGLTMNTPGFFTFRASYEDFTEMDFNVAESYIQFQVNGGGWNPGIAWTNDSFVWGTYNNALTYLFDASLYAGDDVIDYRGYVQDTGGGAQVLLAQGQFTMVAAVAPQDPYPVYGRVYLYDGDSVGGYNPMLSAGCAIDVTWINSTTGLPSTIVSACNGAGQFSVDLLNYTDGGEINLHATFEAPYNNEGWNFTTIDIVGVPGGVEQDILCGIPYDVQITNPVPLATVTASIPFIADYQIVDRMGLLAQGYYTWDAPLNPFSWLSGDALFVPPAARTFDGTADATPALGTDNLVLFTMGLQWINISEGGAELPAPDNFLTPFGAFQVRIAFADNQGWLKDYDNITVNVVGGGFDWDLQQGWNIVSLPQEPTIMVGVNPFYDSEDALENCFLITADPNMQLAARVLPGANPSTYTIYDYGTGEGPAFQLDSVHGYWVFKSTPGQDIVHFDAINWTFPANDVNCEAGWNLLGFTHNYTAWTTVPTASQFTTGAIDADFVTGGAVGNKIVVTDWNQFPAQWYNSYVETTTFPGMPVHDWAWDFSYSAVTPGNGFWLWIEVAQTLTFDTDY